MPTPCAASPALLSLLARELVLPGWVGARFADFSPPLAPSVGLLGAPCVPCVALVGTPRLVLSGTPRVPPEAPVGTPRLVISETPRVPPLPDELVSLNRFFAVSGAGDMPDSDRVGRTFGLAARLLIPVTPAILLRAASHF